MPDTDLPHHALALLKEIRSCGTGGDRAVGLVSMRGIKTWQRGIVDRGGGWSPRRDAHIHTFSAGLDLFDRGLVRMRGKRLHLIDPR